MGIQINGNTDNIGATDGGLTISDLEINQTGISTFNGNIDANGDLDVDGHTNLDNVSIAGVTTATGNLNLSSGNLQIGGNTVINSGRALYNVESVKLADSKELILGSGNDLKIYHSGSHSFIDEVGNGALKIKGDDIRFENASGTEAARIDSSGRLAFGGVSNNDSYDTNARNILLANESGNFGITIRSGGGDPYAMIHFADGTSDNSEKRAGRIFYHHTSNAMIFATDNTERLRITSTGELRVPAGIGAQLRFENQHSVTTDAVISTFDDAAGTLLCLGSNFYLNSSGSETRYNTGEESAGIIINRNGVINFNTGSTGATATTRLSIDSSGRIGVNVTNPASYNNDADALVVSAPSGGGNNSGITIRSNYQGSGSIYFADGSSGNDAYKGYVVYNQPNDIMYLGVQNATKFQINANGAIGLSGSNYGSSGQVLTSQGSGSGVQWASVGGGQVLQTIQATKSDTASYSVSSGGITPNVLEVNITLSSNTSKVLILAHACVNDYAQVFMVLTRNGSTIALGDSAGNRMRVTSGSNLWDTTSLDSVDAMFLDDPYGGSGSVSQITYSFKLRCRDNNTSTIYLNRTEQDNNNSYQARGFTNIIVQEISA